MRRPKSDTNHWSVSFTVMSCMFWMSPIDSLFTALVFDFPSPEPTAKKHKQTAVAPHLPAELAAPFTVDAEEPDSVRAPSAMWPSS